MISVAEAYQFIDACTKPFGTEKVPLLSSLHRTLAIDIRADRDFPPFNRVTMDGIAISSPVFINGRRSFSIESIGAAGSPVKILSDRNNCIEVMTGAILPLNTDAVIPYEQCEIKDGIATVSSNELKPFQNVHAQGTDGREGDILLTKNTLISPAHISAMATAGISEPEVYKLPSVAVLSTGDELVQVEETPLPHQIWQSNVYFLLADLELDGIKAEQHHLPDNKEEMKTTLQQAIQQNEVLLLSGAVSKGKFDYLPAVLEELGMKTIFHRVVQRPGKPFLFGAIGEKLIFGFPGNPVSTFVCYHLYCKRWLHKSLYQSLPTITAKLSDDIILSSQLTHHVLVRVKYEEGECIAEPVFFSTSGDIPALLHADGIISLPAQKEKFWKGEVFEVNLCR